MWSKKREYGNNIDEIVAKIKSQVGKDYVIGAVPAVLIQP